MVIPIPEHITSQGPPTTTEGNHLWWAIFLIATPTSMLYNHYMGVILFVGKEMSVWSCKVFNPMLNINAKCVLGEWLRSCIVKCIISVVKCNQCREIFTPFS